MALHAPRVDVGDVGDSCEDGEDWCAGSGAGVSMDVGGGQVGGRRRAYAPSTTETIPHRLFGVELKVGELDIGDSSVTNTRCAFAAG